MEDLRILDLYAESDKAKIDKFNASVKSEYSLTSNYEKVEADFAWLDIMENTIMYLDNILRNPNRFIINEEEVVKVEQAKRITIESIKHLSKHTNLIQEIEDNGDVRPAKILNVNKDESFNTYENRLIYTLIQNMKMYLDMKEKSFVESSTLKDDKRCEYNAVSKIGAEKISINMTMTAKTNFSEGQKEKNGMTVGQRFEKLKLRVTDLTNTPVYIQLAKEHVAKVIPPVKKTNLILKNTNFQYAMKLWDFLQNNLEDGSSKSKTNNEYKDDINAKAKFDEIFLLNYLVMDSLTSNKIEQLELTRDQVENLTNGMINKIVEINSELPIEEITQKIGDKIAVIKNKKEASIEEVQVKLNSKIQSALSKIINFKLRGQND